MKRFSRIADLILLLLALFIVPAVHAQDTSDQILYAVEDVNRDHMIYTVNVDNGFQNQIGTVRGDGHDAGWSPDGRFIYLLDDTKVDEKHHVQRTLTLVDAETNHRQTLPDPLEGSTCSLPLLWSPNGQWVAYSTYSGSQILLKLFNPTTGSTQTVAALHASYDISEVGWYAALSWSYDGHYLSYHDYEPDNYHTTIYDVQNQQVVDELNGIWSPTENRLAYLNKSGAIIYNLLDGTKQQYEADGIGQWSPDGHFLTIYHVDKDERKTLSVIDIHANKIINFEGESPTSGFDMKVSWSPDGHFLAMLIQEKKFGYKATVYILDVLKGSMSRLKIESDVTTPFKWSPTGHELILATNPVEVEGGRNFTALWWFNFDQHQSHRFAIEISTNAEYYFGHIFDWFANGRYIIIEAIPDVILLDKSTQKLSPIGDTTPFDVDNWWTNGTRIALTSYEPNSDIYILNPETNTLKNVTNTPNKVSKFLGWRGSKNQRSLIFCGE